MELNNVVEVINKIYGQDRLDGECKTLGYGFKTDLVKENGDTYYFYIFEKDGKVILTDDNSIYEKYEEQFKDYLETLEKIASNYGIEFNKKTGTFEYQIEALDEVYIRASINDFTLFYVMAMNLNLIK